MNVWINREDRPKGRTPIWRLKIADEQQIFDDAWVSIKLLTEEAAEWLAQLVIKAHKSGQPIPKKSQNLWQGDLNDDCRLESGNYYAHVEHMNGPFGKGGLWFASVTKLGDPLFFWRDSDIQIRSGEAGRWLCELVMSADQVLPSKSECIKTQK